MGMSISYQTMQEISPENDAAMVKALDVANEGRSWLSSEPVKFYSELHDGKLAGFSKPNFSPDPEDRREAEQSGLPDGTPEDVVKILCDFSRDFGVDWDVSFEGASLGTIQNGHPSDGLLNAVTMLGNLEELLEGDPDMLEDLLGEE